MQIFKAEIYEKEFHKPCEKPSLRCKASKGRAVDMALCQRAILCFFVNNSSLI